MKEKFTSLTLQKSIYIFNYNMKKQYPVRIKNIQVLKHKPF